MAKFVSYEKALAKHDVKDVTKYIYIKKLQHINRLMGRDTDSIDWISDPDGVMKALSGENRTKTAILHSLVAVCTLANVMELPEKGRWKEISMGLRRELDKKTVTQDTTDRDEEGWVEHEDLVKLEAKLDRTLTSLQVNNPGVLAIKERITVYRHLILNLMVLTPPRRLEFGVCLVVSEDDPTPDIGNFIVRDGPHFELTARDYKTVKSHGEQRIKYSLHVSRAIEKSLQLYPRKYLFSKLREPDVPLGNHGFGEFLTTHLYPPKLITASILRKIYVTHHYGGDTGDAPEVERIRVAYEMAHTPSASRLHYQKYRRCKK